MKTNKLPSFLKNFSPTKIDVLVVAFLCIFLPLFLFNLKGFSLVDFDEGWYAAIAKNILVTKNPIQLMFNGTKYLDHPFVGFNLMAVSMLLFGANEFGARFPAAILGFGCLILVYFIGKNLFNRTIGFCASLVLVSCVWFIFRSRTADLDTILLFFYLLTFYCAIRATKSSKWLSVLGLSFFLTLLTKSVIGLTLVAPIVLLFIVRKFKYTLKDALPHIIFICASGQIILWALELAYGQDFFHKYLSIGLRSGAKHEIDFLHIKDSHTILYLHYGIRKWFYPSFIAIFGSIIFVRKKAVIIPIYAVLAILFYGFLTNNSTEIWHLLPLYPFLAILISFFVYKVVEFLILLVSSIANYKNKRLVNFSIICLSITMVFIGCLYQISNFINEIKLFDKSTDPVAYLSQKAGSYQEDLYLDSDVVIPAVAVFYSGKHVVIFRNRDSLNTLDGFILNSPYPFLLITETWRLNLDKVPQNRYEVLAEKEGHVLIKPKNNQSNNLSI